MKFVCSHFLYGDSISRHLSHTRWRDAFPEWTNGDCKIFHQHHYHHDHHHHRRHHCRRDWIRDGLALMLFWVSLRSWQLYLPRKIELRKHFVFHPFVILHFCTFALLCFCTFVLFNFICKVWACVTIVFAEKDWG